MKSIALLTDFGFADNFIGVMKGVILKINSNINIVDISHAIEPHNITEAAFLLKNSYKYFRKGTIFLTVVDPGVGSERKPIIARTKNYLFVGPDNGVLSLAVKEDGIERIIKIENKRYFLKPVSDTFHGRDIFAPIAAYLSKGKGPSLFGRTLNSIKQINIPNPKIIRNRLKGEIIHIDRYGNLVTNIGKDLFKRFIEKKKFKIKIKNTKIDSVTKSYQAVRKDQPLAIFGSFGFLEISINSGSAKKHFNANKGYPITIAI